MSLQPETKSIQSHLARYCRTGELASLPGLTPNRVHHYRRLILSIVKENLESAFPIAVSFIETEKWEAMVHVFFSNHKCGSYQVWQIAGEFYEYAVAADYSSVHQLPYLNDLLKFEWEEMCVYNMEDLYTESFVKEGSLFEDPVVLHPEHKILSFQYPVHLFNPVEAMKRPGQYFALVYRHPVSNNVEFIDLSFWLALVLEQLAQNKTLKELMDNAGELFPNIEPAELQHQTIKFLEILQNKQFIPGFKKLH